MNLGQTKLEMATADADSLMGLAHRINELAQELRELSEESERKSELIYFVTDGEGNKMFDRLNLETAHKYAARQEEYSVGR